MALSPSQWLSSLFLLVYFLLICIIFISRSLCISAAKKDDSLSWMHDTAVSRSLRDHSLASSGKTWGWGFTLWGNCIIFSARLFLVGSLPHTAANWTMPAEHREKQQADGWCHLRHGWGTMEACETIKALVNNFLLGGKDITLKLRKT